MGRAAGTRQRAGGARWWRRAALFAAVNVLIWLGAGLSAAFAVTSPKPSELPAWRTLGGRPIESVEATASDGLRLRGWLVSPATAARGAVVLASGIGRNRCAMADRARHYLDHGWATLLVDLRGTGVSDAARLSFGWHESLDLIAWRDLLRARGFARIGAHGQSVGAAAVTYTAVRDRSGAKWSFVVLEMCYRDVRAAIASRPTFLPAALSWPMVFASEAIADFDADRLVPIDAARQLRCPALLVTGDADVTLGEDATELLRQNLRGEPVQTHVVRGAGHVDLWPVGGDAIRQALTALLDALRSGR